MSTVSPLRLKSYINSPCEVCYLREHCIGKRLGMQRTNSITSNIISHPSVPRGTFLYRQGEAMTGYYLLRSGSAKNIIDDCNGRESVLSFFFPTDLIGVSSMKEENYSDSVVTTERSAYCFITKEDVAGAWRKDPPSFENFLSKVGDFHQYERNAWRRLDHTSAVQRVAAFTVEISDRMRKLGHSPDNLNLPMSRYDISSYLAIAPETVSRSLGQLSEAGYISVEGKHLEFINRARMMEAIHCPPAANGELVAGFRKIADSCV